MEEPQKEVANIEPYYKSPKIRSVENIIPVFDIIVEEKSIFFTLFVHEKMIQKDVYGSVHLVNMKGTKAILRKINKTIFKYDDDAI